MTQTEFAVPPGERYLEDYQEGAVYELGSGEMRLQADSVDGVLAAGRRVARWRKLSHRRGRSVRSSRQARRMGRRAGAPFPES